MILHLSDLHFGTEKQECLRAIERFCQENRPVAIVVSGDLTQRARFKQFYACKVFLDGLKIPYLVVPGNHDIPLYNLWNRFLTPFLRYQLFFGKMENVLETKEFYFVGVNSIRRRHHTRGSISLNQIENVNKLLRNAPRQKSKWVVVHQPFYAEPDDLDGLKDCPALGHLALKIWSKSGLNGLLHGHLHQSAVFDLNQIYDLGVKHPVLDVHAGTATSYRLHHGLPNSFNVIYSNTDIRHYYFSDALQSFVLDERKMNSTSNL